MSLTRLTVPDSQAKAFNQTATVTPCMPTGRVLRNVRHESQKIQRRMHREASRVITRPRLWKVFTAVCDLVVGFNRLRDQVSLEQVGDHANVPCGRNVGRDLRELHELGLICYWPGRGRGHHGTIEVPARFAPEVMLRLAPQPPDDADTEPPAAGATAGRDVEQGGGKVPEARPVSERSPYISLPEEVPQDVPPAANSAEPTGGPAAPAISFTPADVDRVLAQLPDKVRTAHGTTDRVRQVRWIRRLLAAGFTCPQIVRHTAWGLPAVVPSPAGLFAFRAAQLMRTGTGDLVRIAREQAERRRRQEQADQARREAEQRKRARNRMPAATLQLLASMPTETLAAALHASNAAGTFRPPSEMAERAVTWMQRELGVDQVDDTSAATLSARLPRTVSGGEVERAAARVRTWAADVRPVDESTPGGGTWPAVESGCCAACGQATPDARPRPELPLATVACDDCFASATMGVSA